MSGALRLEDETGFWRAAAFISEALEPFDISRLDLFRLYLYRRNTRAGEPWVGTCYFPRRERPRSRRFIHGYSIRVGVRRDHDWPHVTHEVTGSRSLGPAKHEWEYLRTRVEIASVEEALVFVAGHEAFHFLRHSRQVPGRNTEPAANRYGLEWLHRFRRWEV